MVSESMGSPAVALVSCCVGTNCCCRWTHGWFGRRGPHQDQDRATKSGQVEWLRDLASPVGGSWLFGPNSSVGRLLESVASRLRVIESPRAWQVKYVVACDRALSFVMFCCLNKDKFENDLCKVFFIEYSKMERYKAKKEEKSAAHGPVCSLFSDTYLVRVVSS